MTKLESYPFPTRNPKFEDKDIFYIKSDDKEYIQYCYDKIVHPNSVAIEFQFFSIERLLLDSFQYVLPIQENSKTCSVRFATIIREACNLFEILARKAYCEFFTFDQKHQLDIFNFLSLDAFLNLSAEDLRSPILDNYLKNNQKIEPFSTIKQWNKKEKLTYRYIPDWWIAYNKIKHDTESIKVYSNLNNALFSMAALFIMIRKIYGDGLISGFLRKPSPKIPGENIMYQIKTSEIFIGEILRSVKR